MTISAFAIAFRLMQINRPAAEGLALVDRSIPNGRELMHIKVATLGAETLVEFYVVEFYMVAFYVEDSRNETCEGA